MLFSTQNGYSGYRSIRSLLYTIIKLEYLWGFIMKKEKFVQFSVLIFVLVLSGCATYKGGAIQYRDATQFSNSQSIGGVFVAAEALTDSAKIKKIFYADLTEEDYYPIEVVINNKTEQRIFVLKERIEVVSNSGSVIKPTNVTVMIDEFEHNKMAYALLGFGIFSYMSAEEANKKMASDWTSKELARELIVNPNRRGSGFVYVKMPNGTKPTGMELLVPVENLETRAISSIKVLL